MTLSATLVGLGRGTNSLSISNWPLVAFAIIAIQREQKIRIEKYLSNCRRKKSLNYSESFQSLAITKQTK
jgi:hypothetical protein